ncbi:MAG: methylated-DNA--[protein]-cysteine S-methyltransferase [Burkholderiaceae bacterium]
MPSITFDTPFGPTRITSNGRALVSLRWGAGRPTAASSDGVRRSGEGEQALDGHALDGHALDGHALDGHALDGHALDGHALDGHALDGHALDGHADSLLQLAREQLLAYFDGRLQQFDLPLQPSGSPFQRQVFDAMLEIPFGQTRTYLELASRIDSVPRAVGSACGANPIPVIIPCHRVLGTRGLGGFSAAGGVEDKIRLLKLEGSSPVLL